MDTRKWNSPVPDGSESPPQHPNLIDDHVAMTHTYEPVSLERFLKAEEEIELLKRDLGHQKETLCKIASQMDSRKGTEQTVSAWVKTVSDGHEIAAHSEQKLAIPHLGSSASISTVVSLQSRELNEFASRDMQREIYQSAWDAFLFTGFSCLEWYDTLVTSAVYMASMGMQVMFLLLVYANMTQPPIDGDTVHAIKHWRGIFGHSYDHADSQSAISLVSLVCAGDMGLIESASQMTLYQDITQYLNDPPEYEWLKALDGQVMCVLATICWCMSTLSDFHDNVNFTRAVLLQRTGKSSLLFNEDTDSVDVKAISRLHKLSFLALVSFPRLMITGFLSWVGVKYLAYTYSIGDLILNAIALTFILDIDDILYEALAPYKLRRLHSIMNPLSFPAPTFANADKLINVVTIIGMLVLLLAAYLIPFANDLQDIARWMCDGKQNFVTSVNPGSRDLYAYDSNSYDDAHEDSYVKLQTLELAGLLSESNMNSLAVTPPSLQSIASLAKGTIEYGANQLRCVDHLNETSVSILYGVSSHFYGMGAAIRSLQDEEITHCSNVSMARCVSYNGSYIRSICPVTCGCESAWHGNMYATPLHGCPGSCKPSYYNTLQNVTVMGAQMIPDNFSASAQNCSDVNKSVLIETVAWRNYAYGVYDMFVALLNKTQGSSIFNSMMNNGCDSLPLLLAARLNLCMPDQGGIGRSVRAFCPETCKTIVPSVCTTVDLRECPLGCWKIGYPQIAADGSVQYGLASNPNQIISKATVTTQGSGLEVSMVTLNVTIAAVDFTAFMSAPPTVKITLSDDISTVIDNWLSASDKIKPMKFSQGSLVVDVVIEPALMSDPVQLVDTLNADNQVIAAQLASDIQTLQLEPYLESGKTIQDITMTVGTASTTAGQDGSAMSPSGGPPHRQSNNSGQSGSSGKSNNTGANQSTKSPVPSPMPSPMPSPTSPPPSPPMPSPGPPQR